MSQKLLIGITGLATSNNSQTLEDGALVDCENINVDRKIAEGRRGFSKHSAKSGIVQLTEYQGKIIAHTSSNTLDYYNSGWNTYSGTISPASSTQKIRFLQANQNLYFTTSSGIKMLDAYNGSVYSTGMPRGLDGTGSTTGASGFMSNNTQVAYRVIWGTRDANNNLYLGSPSQRIIVSNSTGSTRDISLTFTIPSGITTSDFVQVYRSRMSSGSSTEPDDELQLVYEANPTAGEITAKSITFTDSTPESLRGAYLYTNANQEGITESNDTPPFAHDIAEFKGFTFFANVKTKHYLDITLLGVSGTGLALNDTITINGMVFTAKAAETIASREFKLFTAGSASQNIEDTAKSLIKVINQYSSNTTIYAYYESGYTETPGQILLEERTLSSNAFTVSVSNAVAWSLDNEGTSQNSEYQNGLMWSKNQQPEHVPFAHLLNIGSKSYAIKRILALKDSLFILKEDGVFRLTGTNGAWSVETVDTSTVIIAPDSAVILNNQIFALTNQGIVSISDNGVEVIAEDIKDIIQRLIGEDYSAIQTLTFGTSYETDRKYILSLISVGGETIATQHLVYNVFTGKWSKWVKDAMCGFVAPSVDKLYFADTDNLLEERKTFTYRDFIDEEFGSFSVVSSTGTTVVLNTTAGLTVGDLLYESSSVYSQITSIDPSTNTVTVNDTQAWAVASVTVYKGINYTIEFAPQFLQNGGMGKRFNELVVMFKKNRFVSATMDFYTDLNGGWESVEFDGNASSGLWGVGLFGVGPWGGITRSQPTRLSVPRDKSIGQFLGIRFTCRIAYSEFAIEGLSLQFDYTSSRIGKRVNG